MQLLAKWPFLFQLKHVTLLVLCFFFFLVALTVLLPMAKISINSLVHFCWYLNLFCLSFFLVSSAILSCEEADFESLILGFSRREKFQAVVS